MKDSKEIVIDMGEVLNGQHYVLQMVKMREFLAEVTRKPGYTSREVLAAIGEYERACELVKGWAMDNIEAILKLMQLEAEKYE